jgi:hypothetical protein
MTEEKYYNTDLENWCQDIDLADPSNDFYRRVKLTGIITFPYHFNIYLRKRMPDKKLQHVATWKDELPDTHEIGCTFGSGEAIIDFEVLPGRYRGKKKCGIRAILRFGESYDEHKRKRNKNEPL